MAHNREYWDKWYAANKVKCLDNARRAVLVIRHEIKMAKDRPCADCGIKYPYYVMDFDHGHDKSFTIAEWRTARKGRIQVLAEIAKCDVLCANCHRERTYASVAQMESSRFVSGSAAIRERPFAPIE